LSSVVTVVVLGLTLARRNAEVLSARVRVRSFAIWETATKVLNVLAFVLIGLAIGPILQRVNGPERLQLYGTRPIPSSSQTSRMPLVSTPRVHSDIRSAEP
jgi:hypothetical protein